MDTYKVSIADRFLTIIYLENKNMKKILLILILISSQSSVFAQNTEGIVHFERQMNWVKMIKKLPFLSQEEKDRAEQTWKNDEENKEKMNLYFNEKQSIYTWGQDHQESQYSGYAWRNSELLFYKNFEKERHTDMIEMLGKTYIVDDSLRKPDWKILNQIKEVAGYVCMKAITEDKIKGQKVVAWFTGDIPVSDGPETLWGLPGMILEMDVDDGTVMVTATSVEFKKLDKELVLPKMKGKKVTNIEIDKVVSNHIKDSIKSNRNPYWAIRY